MKILIVDNDTDTLLEMQQLCLRNGHEITTIHCNEISLAFAQSHDMVLLTGGYWYDDPLQHLQTYQKEIAFIRETTLPILGICIGMQLMQLAYSGEVPELDERQTGSKEISVTPLGQKLLDLPEKIIVYKNHSRGVLSIPSQFDVLATSPDHIEIMKHKTKPLVGVQFHPEMGDEKEMDELFMKLLSLLD